MKRNNEKQLSMFYDGGLHKHLSGTGWRPLKKRVTTASVIFFFFLLVSALVFLGWIDAVSLSSYSLQSFVISLSSKLTHLTYHSILVTRNFNGNRKGLLSLSPSLQCCLCKSFFILCNCIAYKQDYDTLLIFFIYKIP